MPLPLVVYERIGRWARQLRPRVVDWTVSLVEARSAEEVRKAARRSSCPLVLVDLRDGVVEGLDVLQRTSEAFPNGLYLALDPGSVAGLAPIARELGASHVLSGTVSPPAVMAFLDRWQKIAQARVESSGWSEDRVPLPDPCATLLASLI